MANRSEIRDELVSILPDVTWLDLDTPFIVPGGYFTDFSPRLMKHLQTESEFTIQSLEAILVPELKTAPPFKIPADYFEKFPNQILFQTSSNTTGHTLHLLGKKRITYIAFALAASLLICIGLNSLFMNHSLQGVSSHSFAKLSNSDIEEYLNSHLSLLDKEELFSTIGSSRSDYKLANDIPTASLEHYLDSMDVAN